MNANPQSDPAPAPSANPGASNSSWLGDYPWAAFVLPLAAYMLVGMVEPTAEKPFELWGLSLDLSRYPLIYLAKLGLTMAMLALVWPAYRQFPLRVSPLAPLVGVVGVVLWVALCKLQLESAILTPLGLGDWVDVGQRSAFNPLAHWPDAPALAYGFLAVRFWGLAVVVPLIEEFFLRGFVMRFVIANDWWKVPFGTLTPLAFAAGTVVPLLMHPPSEALAVAVWFTLVTALMFKTRNIWDCVVAHAVTNLLLGIYVVASGDWFLW
jgi:CAAX prenyl protease-like protein